MALVAVEKLQRKVDYEQPEFSKLDVAVQTLFFRSALILRKTTKWDWEKEQNPRKTDEQLIALLRQRGENVERMLEAYKKQKNAAENIVNKLRKNGVQARIVSRNQLPTLCNEADLVISAGGDGTFLSAAAAIDTGRKKKITVVGVNTDPIGSEGHLCVGGKNPPADLIERIVSGRFIPTNRSRIRVTLLNRKHEAKNKCTLALNEVFVGEDEAAKVSTYDVAIDDEPMAKQKSSGFIVCSGSGSTSWYYGVNRMDEKTVLAALEAIAARGIQMGDNTQELAAEIAKMHNDKIPFEADHPNFAFVVREPIFNATYPRTRVQGFAQTIRMRSRCSKGFLVLDGQTKIPFNSGAEVLIEMNPADALCTIQI